MNQSKHPIPNPAYNVSQKPTGAFIGASWAAMLVGMVSYLVGLWNSQMPLYEKGYYFTILMFGLFSAVSLQKSVRDKLEEIPVTGIYFGICWFSIGLSILLLTVGLWNAKMELSEKGFYGISFLLSLFASVAVQKNIRDIAHYPNDKIFVDIDDQENTPKESQDTKETH